VNHLFLSVSRYSSRVELLSNRDDNEISLLHETIVSPEALTTTGVLLPMASFALYSVVINRSISFRSCAGVMAGPPGSMAFHQGAWSTFAAKRPVDLPMSSPLSRSFR